MYWQDSMTRTQLLKSLRSLVAYHRSCGVTYYPEGGYLRSGLQVSDRFSGSGTEPAPARPATPAEPVPPTPDSLLRTSASLAELSREIGQCRICALHLHRKVSTPGRGGSRPRLLIVGDWLVHDVPLQGDELFGIEPDGMLGNMVKAMGLAPDDVFITNLIKCSVEPRYRAQADHLAACATYLKQQIGLLCPRVICTMGTAASQTLLDLGESVVNLRSTEHRYLLADGTGIPVVPTFHPSYLLKNPEMKKPTWDDLQAVRRLLDTA